MKKIAFIISLLVSSTSFAALIEKTCEFDKVASRVDIEFVSSADIRIRDREVSEQHKHRFDLRMEGQDIMGMCKIIGSDSLEIALSCNMTDGQVYKITYFDNLRELDINMGPMKLSYACVDKKAAAPKEN